jgi:uncharacterized Zn finger protein (UPF0148 family)
MQTKQGDTHIKRMAELLSKGATLTDLACPVCSSPLLRLKDGTLWCGKDEKKVIIVKEGEEPPRNTGGDSSLDKLETTLTSKIDALQNKIERTEDVEELGKLTTTLSELLNSLEKIKRIKKS